MKVRQTDVSGSDKRSAELFFENLARFYDMGKMTILDAFARNGQLTVGSYIGDADPNKVFAWELGEEHREALNKLVPSVNVRIGCSYQHVNDWRDLGMQADVIVIDTPQGLHKSADGQVHIEHFDFLERSAELIGNTGIFVLYVNKSPYNKDDIGSHGYDEYEEYDFKKWAALRVRNYGSLNIDEEQAIKTYRDLLLKYHLVVTNVFLTPCFSDVPAMEPYAFRLGLEVARIGRN